LAETSLPPRLVQARGVHQQDDIGRRCRAFGLQAGENAGIVRINPVDLDAGGFGEIGVQRFVGCVVAGRIQVDHLLLRAGAQARKGQCAGDEAEFEVEFDGHDGP
jgi:hypothetical protein